jgi:hypothetical protein
VGSFPDEAAAWTAAMSGDSSGFAAVFDQTTYGDGNPRDAVRLITGKR